MAEWSSTLDSSSGVSDQQSVGSSPTVDTCVLKQDTSLLHPMDGTSKEPSHTLSGHGGGVASVVFGKVGFRLRCITLKIGLIHVIQNLATWF